LLVLGFITRRRKMAKQLARGDKVQWKTPQGTTHGTVVRKVTGTAHVKGHTAKASADAPEYEVKSRQSGKTAIHKPGSLKKTG
jgi:hypothetical protein